MNSFKNKSSSRRFFLKENMIVSFRNDPILALMLASCHLQGKQRMGHFLVMWAQDNDDPEPVLELAVKVYVMHPPAVNVLTEH